MIDLWLIAHKVSGEPAFDIAVQMECPECVGAGGAYHEHCTECDSKGIWWIIPTSGHRAYPYDQHYLESDVPTSIWLERIRDMPKDLPDHYAHSASPAQVRERLANLLASLPPVPKTITKGRR